MPMYRITYRQSQHRNAYVTAVSESAARQAFIDGDVDVGDDESIFDTEDVAEILQIDRYQDD